MKYVLILSAVIMTAGCVDPDDNKKKPEDTVFGTQVESYQKAKQVQQTINDAAQRQHEYIEEQEQ